MELVTKGAAQQGTFNGNPLSSAAGLAALTQVLTRDAYDHLGKLGSMLAEGCDRAIADAGVPAHTVDLGAKGCVSYRAERLTNYRDFLETHTELYWASYPWMVNRGIFMTPATRSSGRSPCSTPRTTSSATSTRSASSARPSWPSAAVRSADRAALAAEVAGDLLEALHDPRWWAGACGTGSRSHRRREPAGRSSGSR